MSSHVDTALYSPYGAYELKSKYQRNFAFGTLTVVAAVLLILLVSWILTRESEEVIVGGPVTVIKTIAELGPPPTLAKVKPQVQMAPQVQAPKVGIPKPVADDEVVDDNVVLATREDLADIQAPEVSANAGDANIVVDIQEEDYLPSIDEFVPVEQIAEMVAEEKPIYPRLQQQMGMEGVVWIKALVKSDGTVGDAVIQKTSGNAALDQAALDVAKKNKFKPALQNGRPVAMWVSYKVDFTLAGQ
jgi:TonB family protein